MCVSRARSPGTATDILELQLLQICAPCARARCAQCRNSADGQHGDDEKNGHNNQKGVGFAGGRDEARERVLAQQPGDRRCHVGLSLPLIGANIQQDEKLFIVSVVAIKHCKYTEN